MVGAGNKAYGQERLMKQITGRVRDFLSLVFLYRYKADREPTGIAGEPVSFRPI